MTPLFPLLYYPLPRRVYILASLRPYGGKLSLLSVSLKQRRFYPSPFSHFPQSASRVGLRARHYLGYKIHIGLGVLSSSLSHLT
jgi:hypothetical protein